MDTHSKNVFCCQGLWTQTESIKLQRKLAAFQPASGEPIVIDGSELEALDSVGALLLSNFSEDWSSSGYTIKWRGFSQVHEDVFSLVKEYRVEQPPLSPKVSLAWIYNLGQKSIRLGAQLLAYLSFVGA
ncbi:MAG: STAS domain-containing protein, partial [Gammaproteobacteria bacterium]|nr:STAS domain-containing protein [Gammaproteobacteria bacterium]